MTLQVQNRPAALKGQQNDRPPESQAPGNRPLKCERASLPSSFSSFWFSRSCPCTGRSEAPKRPFSVVRTRENGEIIPVSERYQITGSCKKAGTSANHVICPRMSPLVEKNIVFGNFLSEYELLDLCGAIKKYCCDMCIKCIKNYRNSSALELAVAIAKRNPYRVHLRPSVGCKIHCSRSTQGKNMI